MFKNKSFSKWIFRSLVWLLRVVCVFVFWLFVEPVDDFLYVIFPLASVTVHCRY